MVVVVMYDHSHSSCMGFSMDFVAYNFYGFVCLTVGF